MIVAGLHQAVWAELQEITHPERQQRRTESRGIALSLAENQLRLLWPDTITMFAPGGHVRAFDHHLAQRTRQLPAKDDGLRIENRDQARHQPVHLRHRLGEPLLDARPCGVELLIERFDGMDVDAVFLERGDQILQGQPSALCPGYICR